MGRHGSVWMWRVAVFSVVLLIWGCGDQRLSRAEIDTILESEISDTGQEASHWLGTAEAEGYVKMITQGFYDRGARSVWLADFMQIKDGEIPMQLIVEMPIDKTGREAVLERFNQVVGEIEIKQAERLVGNRYLMVPLDE